MKPGVCDMNLRSKQLTSVSGQGIQCSQQSILTGMERFVRSINNMDATVLVPCKLRDMNTIGLKTNRRVPPTMTNTELHNFYLMLNDVKKELLWGTCSMMAPTSHEFVFRSNNNHSNNSSNSSISNGSNASVTSSSSSSSSSSPTNHHRMITCRQISKNSQSSDELLGSLGSSISSNASDTESDADSMITDRDSIEDPTSHIFISFRHHLQGLNSILNQLSDSADYLSSRYLEEIEDTP